MFNMSVCRAKTPYTVTHIRLEGDTLRQAEYEALGQLSRLLHKPNIVIVYRGDLHYDVYEHVGRLATIHLTDR